MLRKVAFFFCPCKYMLVAVIGYAGYNQDIKSRVNEEEENGHKKRSNYFCKIVEKEF